MTASSGGRGISGLVSSPRRRRRLGWGVGLLAVAGVVVAAVRFMPDTNGQKLPEARGGKATIVAPAPKHVKMGRADEAAARSAAAKFVSTAVLRHHVDASWDLTAPELRAGFTRKSWSSGAIPVIPYPADQLDSVRWRLDYTIKDHIGLKVAMVPRSTSKTKALVFEMELVRRGPAASSHWLVDYWAPISPGSLSPDQTASQNQAIAASAPQPIGSAWLLLPIAGIFAVIVVLPVAFLVRGKLRHRRAEQAYRASRAERDDLPAQTSTSSPS